MCQRLAEVMHAHGIRQCHLVRELKISATAVCNMVRKGVLPVNGREELLTQLEKTLVDHGCPAEDARAVKEELQSPPHHEGGEGGEYKEESMIIRRQNLAPSTRQHFRLTRNPFADPACPEDVFFPPDVRYVREVMYDAAVNGNFLAVVGESGSGKTTLREELLARLKQEEQNVVVIEPYILSMVDSAVVGKPLTAEHLTSAIIASVEPGTSVPSGRDARARRMHQVLTASADSGFKHVLLIEEAHDLPRFLLKCLKRFWELKFGQKRLLSIILLGQTELGNKLSSTQADIREVVQRCDTVVLPPIRDCAAFLKHRFERVGVDVSAVFEPEALAALQDRLVMGRDRAGNGVYKGYPLAISNLAMACMNEAAKLGERVVTADIVRQVRP